MAFYNVADNTDTVFSSDIDQFSDAFTGKNDVGTISLFQPLALPGAPTVAVNTTAGILNGAYKYAVAFITGYWKGAIGTGILQTQGNTGGGTASATVSPSAQQVNLTAIPTGPVGTVARIIYRTKAGGSTFYQLTQINDNTTTSWTDNIADTSLTIAMPSTNTTGSSLNVGGTTIGSDGTITFSGSGFIAPKSGGTVGFTNNAKTVWGLSVSDSATPTTATFKNVLDDGAGNAIFAGSLSSVGQSSFKTTANTSTTVAITIGSPDLSTISFAPSLAAGSYNNLVQSGDQGIIFNSKNSSLNASFLTIAPWSTVKSGVRIGSDASVYTAHNVLDDGSGNLLITGGISAGGSGIQIQQQGGTASSQASGPLDFISRNASGTQVVSYFQTDLNGGLFAYSNGSGTTKQTFQLDNSGNMAVLGTLTVGGQQVGATIKSIQRGTIYVTGTNTVTISSINTAKAFLNMPNFGSNSYIYGQITNSTTLTFISGNGAGTCSWEVVEYA